MVLIALDYTCTYAYIVILYGSTALYPASVQNWQGNTQKCTNISFHILYMYCQIQGTYCTVTCLNWPLSSLETSVNRHLLGFFFFFLFLWTLNWSNPKPCPFQTKTSPELSTNTSFERNPKSLISDHVKFYIFVNGSFCILSAWTIYEVEMFMLPTPECIS